jgi:hypothetical protein
MRKILLCMSCAVLVLFSAEASNARPVSYPGGWTVMQMNDGDANSLHVHLSPTKEYSIGYKAQYWRDEEWQFHGLQLNYLVKRWNGPGSQANLYAKAAAGIAYSDFGAFDGKVEEAGMVSMAADWETRRWFTSYENHLMHAGDIHREFSHKARVGVAPYIGDYGDLHTWLMLQVKHSPEEKDPYTITPIVRLFKGVNLVEAGVSEDGDVMFNWIVRF